MPDDELDRLTRALADRYQIERALGSGGMATVYLAHDLKHHRQVAIKVLKPDLAAAVGADRFLREISIAATLNYPHIVPLFDSGEADGLLFYVMPYIAGESLRERLRREKQLPVDEAVSIARQVAAALTYAAGHGIIHRDVKPDNVLLIDGTAMVADFGIARAIVESGSEHLTATGGAIGTPAYMSPEQASGARDLDARSDVYALGCVLYETLAGEPPYTGPTLQSVIAQHLASPVPPVRRLRELVPESIERAITRALAKLPADRFATAQEFAGALGYHIGGGSADLAGTASGDFAAARATRRQQRTIAAALAAVAVLVLFGLNVGGVRDRLTGGSGVANVTDGRRSVAVLPFQNVGGPDDEYFSDGLTEELIVALSQLRSLRVAARTSAFAFKGQARDVREIARALSVAAVLVGSVRKSENRVRVTAQLVDGANGLDVWSETYEERNLSDIFDIQADIAIKIAGALEANLGGSERARLVKKPTEKLDAYTLYLKGLYFWNRRGEHITTAIDYFNRAIAVDSTFARAYAGLASVYAPGVGQGYITPQEGRARMRVAATRAVELDDSLPEGHTMLGQYYNVYEWDWPNAEREFKRAIELDPNFPTAHLWYGYLLETLGRYDESLEHRGLARQLDPLAPAAYTGVAATLRRTGRGDSANSLYRQALEIDPDFFLAYEGLGLVAELAGNLDEARRAFENAVAHAGRTPRAKAGLARIVARSGDKGEAKKLLRELRAQASETGVHHPMVATALAAAGHNDAAFAWLDAAYRERHPDMTRLLADPSYDVLTKDPRFRAVVRRVGLRE